MLCCDKVNIYAKQFNIDTLKVNQTFTEILQCMKKSIGGVKSNNNVAYINHNWTTHNHFESPKPGCFLNFLKSSLMAISRCRMDEIIWNSQWLLRLVFQTIQFFFYFAEKAGYGLLPQIFLLLFLHIQMGGRIQCCHIITNGKSSILYTNETFIHLSKINIVWNIHRLVGILDEIFGGLLDRIIGRIFGGLLWWSV